MSNESQNFGQLVANKLKAKKNLEKEFVTTALIYNSVDDSEQTKIEFLENFGGFAFILGNINDVMRNFALGFTMEDEKFQTNFLIPLNKRLKAINQSEKVANTYLYWLIKLSDSMRDNKEQTQKFFDFIQAGKDLLIAKINEEVAIDKELKDILLELFTLNDYNVSAEYAVELNKLIDRIKDGKLKYHDFLLINSYIFEYLEMSDLDSVTSNIITLSENSAYQTFLEKASEYFDNQKFGLIYYESIVQLLETIYVFENPIKIKNLNNKKDINFNIRNKKLKSEKQSNEQHVAKTDEPVKSNIKKLHKAFNKNEYKPMNITQNDNIHTYIHKLLFNAGLSVSKEKLTKEELILRGFEHIFESEEQENANNLFMNAFNQKEITTEDFYLWLPVRNELKKSLKAKQKELEKEFKTKLELYVQDIPEEIKEELINRLDFIIGSALVMPANLPEEGKGILFEQVHSNKVHTYKQLNQMLEIIEKCKIKNTFVSVYQEFVEYITDKDKGIIDRLNLSIELNQIQNKQHIYLIFDRYLKLVSKQK